MAELHAFVERRLSSPTEVVYRCIADFREHHWRYLPEQFFDYHVEEGGFGAGTIIRFKGRGIGKPRAFRMICEESDPGRELVERDLLSSLVTTTRIVPDDDGCRVSFETVWTSAPGIPGLVERLIGPAMLRRLFTEELARLDRYAQDLAASERIVAGATP